MSFRRSATSVAGDVVGWRFDGLTIHPGARNVVIKDCRFHGEARRIPEMRRARRLVANALRRIARAIDGRAW